MYRSLRTTKWPLSPTTESLFRAEILPRLPAFTADQLLEAIRTTRSPLGLGGIVSSVKTPENMGAAREWWAFSLVEDRVQQPVAGTMTILYRRWIRRPSHTGIRLAFMARVENWRKVNGGLHPNKWELRTLKTEAEEEVLANTYPVVVDTPILLEPDGAWIVGISARGKKALIHALHQVVGALAQALGQTEAEEERTVQPVTILSLLAQWHPGGPEEEEGAQSFLSWLVRRQVENEDAAAMIGHKGDPDPCILILGYWANFASGSATSFEEVRHQIKARPQKVSAAQFLLTPFPGGNFQSKLQYKFWIDETFTWGLNVSGDRLAPYAESEVLTAMQDRHAQIIRIWGWIVALVRHWDLTARGQQVLFDAAPEAEAGVRWIQG